MLRGIVQFVLRLVQFLKLVTINCVQTLLIAGNEAINEISTVNNAIKSTLKFTVGVVLGAKVDQVAYKLIEMRNKQNDAPPPNSFIVDPELVQAKSGTERRRQSVYKTTVNVENIFSANEKLPIIFKMATIGGHVTEEITSEVDLFGSIM